MCGCTCVREKLSRSEDLYTFPRKNVYLVPFPCAPSTSLQNNDRAPGGAELVASENFLQKR